MKASISCLLWNMILTLREIVKPLNVDLYVC